jgi:N-acetylglucosamine-6-phosphate deacetylase
MLWQKCTGIVLTPSGWQEYDLNVVDGVIADVASRRGEVLDVSGLRIVPGYIDLQVNGGWGYDLQQEPASLWVLGQRLVEIGVTSFLPTLTTNGHDRLAEALTTWRLGPRDRATFAGAEPIGWHLEGPWLAPSRHGAHRRELLAPVPAAVPPELAPEHGVRLVTLAPELRGAVEMIETLTSRRVVVSCGHSEASAAQSRAAFAAGATMGTHLFNAMSGTEHRCPGLAAALLLGNVYLGLIVDGVHVSPELIQLAWLVGRGRVVAVSDAVAVMGTELASARGEPARLADGTIAGSVIGLDAVVRNLMRFTGCELADAVLAASEVPARCLGLPDRGRIAEGQRADLVGLDRDANVVLTLVAGSVVYDRR